MSYDKYELISPDVHLQKEFYCYCGAYQKVNEPTRWLEELAYQDYPAYIKKLADASEGIGLALNFVPANVYWLIREGYTILGNSSLRHWLTPALEDVGGHIGYSIHPFERRKGYGTLILQLTMEKAREKGLRKVMVTCNTDNVASAGVIVKNGGVLANQGISQQTGIQVSRYWIEL